MENSIIITPLTQSRTLMKQFVEFVPIALFVAVYFYFDDIFIATGVLMAGVTLQVIYEYATTKRVDKRTQVIFWVVIIFGAATLLFRNETFLLWKPTVVNWLFALALFASHLLSRENLLKNLLGAQLPLPDHVWRNLSLGWGCGFFIAGALNLVVAFNFSLDFWVSYKLFGGVAITLVYMVIMMVYLVKGGYLSDEALAQKPDIK